MEPRRDRRGLLRLLAGLRREAGTACQVPSKGGQAVQGLKYVPPARGRKGQRDEREHDHPDGQHQQR